MTTYKTLLSNRNIRLCANILLLLGNHRTDYHAEKYSHRLFGWTETCILPGFHGNLFLDIDEPANVMVGCLYLGFTAQLSLNIP